MSTQNLTAETVDPGSAGENAPPRPSRAARLLLWTVLAAVLFHSAAVALWVAPDNLLKRAVGVERLRSYVLPMFDQGWSVFAPEADFAYDMVEIRGYVLGDDGQRRETDWIKITAREVVKNIKHRPFPSRTGLMTTRLIWDIHRTFGKLSNTQKERVTTSGANVSTAELGSLLDKAATNDLERRNGAEFMRMQEANEHFLSGIAHAVWGSKVESIQYRRNRMTVANYLAESSQRQVETGYTYYSGWRPMHALSDADRSAFSDYASEFGIGAER